MKEIGSEFWTTESLSGQELFFVSGRTALDFIIRDILAEKPVNKAFLPSYCCHSMIVPFLKNELTVEFYDVYPDNGTLKADTPTLSEGDIFFSIKYFGYKNQDMAKLFEIKNTGGTIISDLTHSWLTESDDFSDYSFISYRKWTGLTGIAAARKSSGRFFKVPKENIFSEYEQLRLKAQQEKASYISDGAGEKEQFLSLYSRAEELLDREYENYTPTLQSLSSLLSLDIDSIISARRKNAATLYNRLSRISEIVPIFSVPDKADVPMCVPVMVQNGLRNELRQHLITEQIYCPVHWIISDIHGSISPQTESLYRSQISLICDQRYTAADMERIANSIEKFFKQR